MQNRENAGKNKKTVLTIAIALLLVLALALGGFTFARYISQGSGSDTARVAAWGFKLSVGNESDNGFQTIYRNGDNEVIVEASDSTKVVAPGTAGKMTFSIDGTAEVAAKVTMTVGNNANIEQDVRDIGVVLTPGEGDAITYNPVRFTLKKGGTTVQVNEENKIVASDGTAVENVSLGRLATILETSFTEEVRPTEDITKAGTYTIEWSWAFENMYFTADGIITDDSTGNLSCDVLDTIIAQPEGSRPATVMIGLTEYSISGITQEIGFALSISVEQINDLEQSN